MTMTLDELKEAVADICAGCDTQRSLFTNAQLADALDAAIKQREHDKRDAARYRHMIETSPFMCFGASEYSKKSDLDEAIDDSIAAMAKESGR